MFEPFVQGDGSATRRVGGAGLGLAITRRFVHLLGGRLSARSVVGQGSVFRIELPIDPLHGGPVHPGDEVLAE
jgi:signal transduction histidine kinase